MTRWLLRSMMSDVRVTLVVVLSAHCPLRPMLAAVVHSGRDSRGSIDYGGLQVATAVCSPPTASALPSKDRACWTCWTEGDPSFSRSSALVSCQLIDA
jgi:hypothetical protein